MTVRGAGTNLSGGTIPDSKESVVILTNGLNRILEINSDDLYAVVEPGVVTATFAAEVAKKNLFYPRIRVPRPCPPWPVTSPKTPVVCVA